MSQTATGLRLKTAVVRELKTAWLDNENRGKEVLLFLHGYLDTPAAWRPQAAAFSEKYQVLVPFARGVGESAPPRDKRRYGASSILLDHLEILRLNDPERTRPVHVVGHDVGGVHAWMLACHPARGLRSAAILNSVHPRQYLRRILWPRQVLKAWYVGAFQVPYVSEALLWLFRKEIFKTLEAEGWRPPVAEMSLSDFEGAAINAMNQYRQFVRDIPHFLRENAAPTPVPVLVVSSEEDRYLETPSATEYSDIASNVTIRVVKGRHWLAAEQPERVIRLLEDFWSQVPR